MAWGCSPVKCVVVVCPGWWGPRRWAFGGAGRSRLRGPPRERRAVVREILIGPDGIVIRHSIPAPQPDSNPDYLLRGRTQDALRCQLVVNAANC